MARVKRKCEEEEEESFGEVSTVCRRFFPLPVVSFLLSSEVQSRDCEFVYVSGFSQRIVSDG